MLQDYTQINAFFLIPLFLHSTRGHCCAPSINNGRACWVDTNLWKAVTCITRLAKCVKLCFCAYLLVTIGVERVNVFCLPLEICVLRRCVYWFPLICMSILAVSKGHAAPILYAVWAETGYLKESELLNLRKIDSILEGHPVPVSSRGGGAYPVIFWPARLPQPAQLHSSALWQLK